MHRRLVDINDVDFNVRGIAEACPVGGSDLNGEVLFTCGQGLKVQHFLKDDLAGGPVNAEVHRIGTGQGVEHPIRRGHPLGL